MELKEVKTEYRMQEMQKAIQARTESGLTISEWCQKNNISKGTVQQKKSCIMQNDLDYRVQCAAVTGETFRSGIIRKLPYTEQIIGKT